MSVKLSPSQAAIVKRIIAIGGEVGATHKELKAAIATGRVESNFTNSAKMTDHDSQGWRQERASLYKDPTNLDASIRRYFKETRAVRDKYATAGELAAAVQRPAAQYRGRYAQVGAEAEALLRQYGGSSSGSAVARAARVSSTARSTTTPATAPEVDIRGAIVDALLARKGGSGSLLKGLQSRLATGAYTTPGTPARTTTTKSTTPAVARAARTAATASAPTGKAPGKLLELFWQGAGGINAKNGAKVQQGFVSGHTDHVHVAADTPANIIAIGRIAQQKFGLHVGEQPHFGAVHQVHVANSNHYSNRAIDVSGDPKKMRAFAHYVAGLYGVK